MHGAEPGVQHVQGLFLSLRVLGSLGVWLKIFCLAVSGLELWNLWLGWKDAAPNDVKWLLCWNSFSQGVVAFNSQFPTQTQVSSACRLPDFGRCKLRKSPGLQICHLVVKTGLDAHFIWTRQVQLSNLGSNFKVRTSLLHMAMFVISVKCQ